MKKMKYFKVMANAYNEPGGMVYAPQGVIYPLVRDAEEVTGYENLYYELRDGEYTHFLTINKGANIVSEDLKNTILEFIPDNYPLEFLPIIVHSKIYGEQKYFILHFREIFDVTNKENTVYSIEGDDSSVIKLYLDANKVNGLNIFNSQSTISDIIISDTLKKVIKKRKYDKGMYFSPLFVM